MTRKMRSKLFDMDETTIDTSTDTQEEATNGQNSAAQGDDPVAELESENQLLKEKVLRLHADIENMRRHAAEDRVKLIHEGTKSFAEKLLPALDTFDLAIHSIPKEIAEHSWVEGIRQFERLLKKLLLDAEIQKMEIVPNTTEFNPELHEALGQISASDEVASGTITQVYQQGYTFKNAVLRTAKVQVAL